MAIAHIAQHQFVASYKPDQAANARAETQAPGPLITDPENFTVTGADEFELNVSPAPKYCMVAAVEGTLYVRSGTSTDSIAESGGEVIFSGMIRPIYVENGHTHLLFFGA